LVVSGVNPKIAVDSQGHIHLGYYPHNSGGFYYIERFPSGNWTTPVRICGECFGFGSDLTEGPDDTVHFVWQEGYTTTTKYRRRFSDGTWSSDETVSNFSNAEHEILIDQTNVVHLAARDRYVSRSPDGDWSEFVDLPATYTIHDMVMDSQGILYLLSGDNRNPYDGLYYHVKRPGQEWSIPQLVPVNGFFSGLGMTLDTDDRLHVGLGKYYITTRESVDSSASISQSVIIPSDMYSPTLSFHYEIGGLDNWTRSRLEVTISDSTTTTTSVHQFTNPVDWSHLWSALSPWAGQSITLTFTLNQAAGEPFVNLLLDDVSLGSWTTPILNDYSPVYIPANAPFTLNLTGMNFIETPTVFIDSYQADNVSWIDANTLTATFDSGFLASIYSLKVVNPSGTWTVLSISIGETLFLPFSIH
jgi:hypothetical protein